MLRINSLTGFRARVQMLALEPYPYYLMKPSSDTPNKVGTASQKAAFLE